MCRWGAGSPALRVRGLVLREVDEGERVPEGGVCRQDSSPISDGQGAETPATRWELGLAVHGVRLGDLGRAPRPWAGATGGQCAIPRWPSGPALGAHPSPSGSAEARGREGQGGKPASAGRPGAAGALCEDSRTLSRVGSPREPPQDASCGFCAGPTEARGVDGAPLPPQRSPSFPLPEAILNAPEPQAPELKIPPRMACGKAAPGYFSGLVLLGSVRAPGQGGRPPLRRSGPAGPTLGAVHSGAAVPDGRGHQSAGRGQSRRVPEPSPRSQEADSAQREGQRAPRGHSATCHGGLGSPLSADALGSGPSPPEGHLEAVNGLLRP